LLSRSQRHAKAKFFGAARNRIRDYPVNSDRRDNERNPGEQTEQQSEKSRTRLRGRKNVFHEANVGNGNRRIDGLHFLAHGAGQRDCITVGAQDDKGIIVTAAVLLRVREIKFGAAGRSMPAFFTSSTTPITVHIAPFMFGWMRRPMGFRFRKMCGQRLINDDHIGRAGSVASIEERPSIKRIPNV